MSAAVAMLPAAGRAAPGAGTLFGTDASGGNLLLLNQSTGTGMAIGMLGFNGPSLAIDPASGTAYAGGGGGTPTISTVDLTTGAGTLLGDTGLGLASVGSLDFRADGVLFAAVNIAANGGSGSDHLATIDLTDGSATVIGPFGSCTDVVVPAIGGGSCDLDGIEAIAFDQNGVLWGALRENNATGTPGLYTIDPTTGAATFVSPIVDAGAAPPQGGIVSMQFGCDGRLWAGTAQTSGGANDGGTLGTIDVATGVFTPVGAMSAATGGLSLGGLAFRAPCVETCDHAGNPFTNCSFETGDFTGWTPADLATPFFGLGVDVAGIGVGFGFFQSEPTDGIFAALNGFDGDGPGVIQLAQDVALPPGTSMVKFDYRLAWDLVNFCAGCLENRRFEVSVQPSGGGAPMQTTLVTEAAVGTMMADTGPSVGMVDVSAFAGQAVRISFDWTVPESFTGPGFAQLDNVSVTGCGSGSLDPGEECDDANAAAGDGCDAQCRVETCWACTGSPSSCVPNVRTDCRVSTNPAKTRLLLKDKSTDKKDALVWKWKKGQATALADFGDPTTADDYVLCVFDESGGTPGVLLGATIPAGPGWSAKGSKIRYKDKAGAIAGIRAVLLKAGADGKAALSVKAKGEGVPLPSLPLGLPVRVQLRAEGGACWDAAYATAAKNTPALFKAKGN